MRKLVWVIPPLILILAVAAFAGKPGREESTVARFEENRAVLEELAQQVLAQGNAEGITPPAPWRSVELYRSGPATVEFAMGGFGLGGGTAYWGVNYVPDGSYMVGFQGQQWDYWKAQGDGRLYYDPEGDNTCYVKKLAECWYYYEMKF